MEHIPTPDNTDPKTTTEETAAQATSEHGIAEAKSTGSDVDLDTARTIPSNLSDTNPAETPEIDVHDGERDHLTIIQPGLDGGFMVHISTTDSPDAVDAAITKSRELINYFGQAFRAYLTLPNVYATDPKLEENFHEFYVATYPNIVRVIEDLTEVLEWESDLQEFAAERGIEGLVSLDRAGVERVVRYGWDIIEMGGQLHVFIK